MSKLIVILVVALVAGCYTTRDIPGVQFQKLQGGLHSGELILRTDKGEPVRFGPRSKIRFRLQDRRWTSWYRGQHLRVNRVGVCAKKGCTPPRSGWRWDQIKSAQVNNLSGGKTYAAVFITVAVVAVTVAVIAAVVGSKGKMKLPKLKGLFPRGARVRGLRPRGSVRVGRLTPRGGSRVGGLRPRGGSRVGGLRPRGGSRVGGLRPRGGSRVGRLRPHHHRRHPGPVSGQAVTDIFDGLPPPDPDPDPDPDPQESSGATDAERPGSIASGPPRLTLHASPSKTSNIFGRRTRRRSSIRLIGLVEGGSDLLLTDGGNIQALVGMRILDVLELAAGAHLMFHRGESQTEDHRASWIGVFRLNLHFDVDARRRVALPIGFDVGTGHATFYARLNIGLRVRLTRRLSLGIYPFNPTYAEFKDTTLKRKSGWWSFPTTIDLSFAM